MLSATFQKCYLPYSRNSIPLMDFHQNQLQKSQNLAPAPDFPPFEYFIFDTRD